MPPSQRERARASRRSSGPTATPTESTSLVEERITFPSTALTALTALVEGVTRLGDIGLGFELSDGMAWTGRFAELSPASHERRRRRPSAMPVDRFDDVGKVFLAHPTVTQVELVNLLAPLVPDEVTATNVEFGVARVVNLLLSR